jgi:CheY-like chemotaxis protein
MPGMDGFEVCARIREPALNRSTPVVFVTASTDSSMRDRMELVGGNDFSSNHFSFLKSSLKR